MALSQIRRASSESDADKHPWNEHFPSALDARLVLLAVARSWGAMTIGLNTDPLRRPA
jgi:hypothetical protein